MEEDIDLFGTAYWHRLHQIPALRVCHRHQTPLVKSRVRMGEAQTFRCIEESLLGEIDSEKGSAHLQKVLGDAFEALARFDKPLPDREQLNQTIYSALSSAGVIGGTSLAEGAVAEMLFMEYGPSPLAEAGFTATGTLQSLIRANFRQGAAERYANPVLTILLAALSGKLFAELIEKASACAPSISNRIPGGRRACVQRSVGGSNRVEPPAPPQHPSWLPQLRALWSDRKQTWMSLTAATGQPRARMAYHAAKLRLPNMPGRRLTSQRAHALGKQKKRLDWTGRWHKRVAEFTAFKEEHPSARRSTLAKANYNLYQWVKSNRPDLLATLQSARTFPHRYSGSDEFDQATAAAIREQGPAARTSLLKSHLRITRSRLLRAMNKKITLNQRRRPHQTLVAISEFVETNHQHFERLFENMRKALEPCGSPTQIDRVVKNAHLQRYYLNFENYRTRIRGAILDARLAADRRRLPGNAAMP